LQSRDRPFPAGFPILASERMFGVVGGSWRAFCSARHLSSVHQTKFREPAKPRNIVDPASLLGGQQ
jgi:hypothetical protein